MHQWSQSHLARELGVSRQAVNGFESGKFDPSLEMAFKIASLFHVAIEDVFIYEAKNSMQTLVERVTKFFGLEIGFERFTEKAIAAVNRARNEAVQSGSLQVEPEHILAGLLGDSTTIAARLLHDNGMILNIETTHSSFKPREKVKFSSQSKFVLELALQIVRLNAKKSIGTEHILWGLVQLAETDKDVSNELFQGRGIDITKLRESLIDIL